MKVKLTIVLAALFFTLLLPYQAESSVAIVGGLTHVRVVTAGETYSGVILLRNIGEEPEEVKVYQVDYLFFCDGRNIYGEPGKGPRSNAGWITVSPKSTIIPAKETATIHYTINVPDNETLTGTYWSMFMVEGIPKDSPEASQPEKTESSFGIKQVFRYGVQMVTQIGETGSRKLKYLKTKLLREDEKKILQVDIENSGERWLRPLLWAELYDEKGSYIGRFEAGRLRIYPETSVRFRVDLSQVPKGHYKALVVADCGGNAVFGATYTLRFEK
jgi:hypothetical protein